MRRFDQEQRDHRLQEEDAQITQCPAQIFHDSNNSLSELEVAAEDVDDGEEEANALIERARRFTDKDFYREMREIKDRTDASKPPKKPASAYILFQKDVSKLI